MEDHQTLRLTGRTALITGASRGIGFAIAKAFARQGANLILTATNESGLQSAKNALDEFNVDVSYIVADLAEPGEVESLFPSALEHQPELDVLVNNAGIHIGKPFTEYDMGEFDRVMSVNLYAVFQLTQHAIVHMQELGRGKVINIASTAGKWESPNQAAYNISKHGVVGLTRCVALENAQNNINVNAICPGMVETDILKSMDLAAEELGVTPDELRQTVQDRIPMGRFLEPDEVAHIAVYLAADESNGMTGQTITISGGMRMG